ncbi:TPA: hypothetical protein ACJEU7_001858 [Acinetobacter baumannii]
MRLIKKLTLLTLVFSSVSAQAQADSFQSYYNNSEEIMTSLKKCNQLDPFSKAKFTCLSENEVKINKKTKEVYEANRDLFESLQANLENSSKYNINDPSYAARIENYKKACEDTYPKALQPHFATPIKECKVEIDLQRYFMFAQSAINF